MAQADRRAVLELQFAVRGARQGFAHGRSLVGIVGRHGHACVVGLAAGEVAIVAHDLPRGTAILGAPQLTVVGRLAVQRNAVARLDQRVDTIRIRLGDRESHLADDVCRQSVPLELRPRGAAVARHVDRAPRTAAFASPGVDQQLPRGGEQLLRVRRIHHDVDGAGVLVHEEHAFPRVPAVARPEHAALPLRAVAVALGSNVHDVRIPGIDHDASDASAGVESHTLPGAAGVGGFVDAVAERDVRADPRLARPGPHDVVVRARDAERSDGCDLLIVEDRLPVNAGIGRLPDAAARRASVVHVRIADHTRDGRDAVAHGSDVPVSQRRRDLGIEVDRDDLLLGRTVARRGTLLAEERCRDAASGE